MKTNTYTFTNRAMAIVIAVMLMVMTFVSAIPVSAASRLDTTETVSFTANCDKSGYTFTVYKVANLVSTTTSPYETKYESLVPQIKDSVLSGDTASVLSALDSVTQMPDTATVVGTYCSDDADTVTFDNLEQGIYYVKATNIGTPQGGNLSPLLSNIMLNELDKELESRGQRFTRYADDVVIVLKSKAATRVMYSITSWIERKLGLKVNATKTKITPPSKLKYLGFGFWKNKTEWKARPHESSVLKFKRKLKQLCKRSWSIDLTYRIKKINEVTRGWINYFRIGSMKNKLYKIDEHLRTMIRVIIWKQWKVPKKRLWGLLKLGVPEWIAHKVAYWGNHYQFVATRSVLKQAVSKEILTKRGLVSIYDYYLKVAHI